MSNTDPLPRSTPEQHGIASSAIQAFVETVEQKIKYLHSFMLLRHGHVVAEGWWQPYRAEKPHMLFSLSKSFTSSAVGMAINEGLLALDDQVIKFFPAQAPDVISPNLAAMQVRHLLSMSSGHELDTTDRAVRTEDPIKAFLSLPVERAPGSLFVYNSGATFMLSAIVQKLSGQTLTEYLTPRLFEPLGIQNPRWESHPNGVEFGGWGLNIKTEDIARFGQLYLQKGLWHGQQLIPASWVAAATSKQIANDANPDLDWHQGYGYQFWRCSPRAAYRGDGAFGQYCIVMPEQDAVLAITSGLSEMQPVLDAVWAHLLPAMAVTSLPVNQAAVTELTNKLADLKLSPRQAEDHQPSAALLAGKMYKFDENPEGIRAIGFDFQNNSFMVQTQENDKIGSKHQLSYGSGTWVESVTGLGWKEQKKVSSSGVWVSDDSFELTLCYNETPFITTLLCKFEGQQVTLQLKYNVGFGPLESTVITGSMA
jgi:CubicO group peptidase (beta-lactamase class C family)